MAGLDMREEEKGGSSDHASWRIVGRVPPQLRKLAAAAQAAHGEKARKARRAPSI